MKGLAFCLLFLALPGMARGQPEPGEEDPSTSYIESGDRLFRLGRYDAAISQYQTEYELHSSPVAILLIARAQEKAGRPADAIASYRRFLELTSSNQTQRLEAKAALERLGPALAEAAGELLQQGQYARAIEAYEVADRVHGAASHLYSIALAHEGLGHAIEAIEHYERFLAVAGASASDRPLREDATARVARLCAVLSTAERQGLARSGRSLVTAGRALVAVGLSSLATAALSFGLSFAGEQCEYSSRACTFLYFGVIAVSTVASLVTWPGIALWVVGARRVRRAEQVSLAPWVAPLVSRDHRLDGGSMGWTLTF